MINQTIKVFCSVIILTSLLLLTSCGGSSGDRFPVKEGRQYADKHFNYDNYLRFEYDVVTDASFGEPFRGDMEAWLKENPKAKEIYLKRRGFYHQLPTESERRGNSDAQDRYYQLIGRQANQFGPGWDDSRGDDLETADFDGRSDHLDHYRKTWLQR